MVPGQVESGHVVSSSLCMRLRCPSGLNWSGRGRKVRVVQVLNRTWTCIRVYDLSALLQEVVGAEVMWGSMEVSQQVIEVASQLTQAINTTLDPSVPHAVRLASYNLLEKVNC